MSFVFFVHKEIFEFEQHDDDTISKSVWWSCCITHNSHEDSLALSEQCCSKILFFHEFKLFWDFDIQTSNLTASCKNVFYSVTKKNSLYFLFFFYKQNKIDYSLVSNVFFWMILFSEVWFFSEKIIKIRSRLHYYNSLSKKIKCWLRFNIVCWIGLCSDMWIVVLLLLFWKTMVDFLLLLLLDLLLKFSTASLIFTNWYFSFVTFTFQRMSMFVFYWTLRLFQIIGNHSPRHQSCESSHHKGFEINKSLHKRKKISSSYWFLFVWLLGWCC